MQSALHGTALKWLLQHFPAIACLHILCLAQNDKLIH